MNSFEIIGGTPLSGEVIPQGAKNEALQVIACTLLSAEKITIQNIPDILDVRMLIELLQDLGVEVEKIIKILADNSKTFKKKTNFAQEKYLSKKKKK